MRGTGNGARVRCTSRNELGRICKHDGSDGMRKKAAPRHGTKGRLGDGGWALGGAPRTGPVFKQGLEGTAPRPRPKVRLEAATWRWILAGLGARVGPRQA